ncbi:leucine-rich repeat protein [Hoylesella oralis]|uniref:leucine-rich repeat domain-containing protein n=1 Tax=Hoylesella oralis TaxID=28134 RepID=UPI0028F0DBA9|nr:leucine-rich repeat protein [Hoylesella oralis]
MLLFVLLLTNIGAKAYVVGEYFVKDHITYRVIDASTSSPKLAVYNVKGVSGTVTIPATVFDGIDTHFKVTQIGGGTDNDPIRWDATVTGVNLPNTITTLSNYSFAFSGITSLTLPASVTTISPWANVLLGRCYELKEILVNAGNPSFISDDGVLYTKGHEELICVPFNKDLSSSGNCLTINSNTKKVHVDAMGNTPTLQKLVVPASVNDMYMNRWPTFAYTPTYLKEIEVDANNSTYCSMDGVLYSKDKTMLIYYPAGKTNTTFKVPNGVKSIPYGQAIAWNKYLTSIDFNEVDTVCEYAVSVCHNLKVINIPKSLTSIGEAAFYSFIHLEKYVVAPDNPNYCSDADGVLFNKDKTQLLFYPTARKREYIIPNSVTKIGKLAFELANITTITIPANVSDIGYEAFRETKLKTVSFEEPSTITSLTEREFLWCHSLKTVTLPKSLKTLGNAFSGCKNLETVNVPNGSQLETIQSYAFTACDNLTNFNFLGSCNLKTIGGSAFADMAKLKEFNFPASVTNIGANAFGNTPAMEKVTFDDNSVMISFGEGAFSNSGIKSIKIPAGVKSIAKEAFKNCNVLEKVTVPAGCTNIDPQAFKFDSKLADIEVDANNTVYSSVQGILLSKDKSKLILFPPGKARTDFTLLPPSITKIGDYAFYESGTNFTNLVIPAKVNTIGQRAFGLCRSLKTLTLLCDQVIPSTKIDQGTNTMAFDDGTVASDKATDHVTVYVRKNLFDAYKADAFWSKFNLKPSFTVKAEGTTTTDATDEYIPTSANTADLLSTTANVKTFIVPKQISYRETGAAAATNYKVGLIGDYAFENANGNMKEVVVKADIDYIGAMAFVTKTQRNAATNTISPVSTTISQVVFTGNAPATQLSRNYFGLGAQFSEFFKGTAGTGACTQKIYVKKSKLAAYKTAWPAYTDALDYKIKGDGAADFQIATKYASFAREFDTDFADYLAAKGNTKIAAFVAGSQLIQGPGDYGTSTYHVRMTSIDEHGGNASYAYIPAATGVLLKVLDREKTDADFYYTIGEEDDRTYNITDNVMTGITVTDARVEASSTSPIYVMRAGLFRKVDTPIESFPVHGAYMKIKELQGGAKVIFDFKDPTTTGIESISADGTAVNSDDAYYNLNGQRFVGKPQQAGIYIHRGKKIVIK